MSIKNKISESIKQQFSQYYDNYLAYAIHQWAANDISDSIALCIAGDGNCMVRYKSVADSFDITKKEVEQGDIVHIKSKIESEAKKECSEFSKLISRFDQSLKEQSEKSILQILDSSAEEMLKNFCEQLPSATKKTDSQEYRERNLNEESNLVVPPEESTEDNSASSAWWWP